MDEEGVKEGKECGGRERGRKKREGVEGKGGMVEYRRKKEEKDG